MFLAKVFTIAQTWKKPTCPLTWIDKENVVHTYCGLLHHLKKEENSAIYNSMDGHAVHYAKWNKPDTQWQKWQILCNFTYMQRLSSV